MELDRKEKVAYLTMQELNSLLEYSHSLPTGQTPGKLWRRRAGKTGWWIGQYGEPSEDGKTIPIYWHEVYIVTPSMVATDDAKV